MSKVEERADTVIKAMKIFVGRAIDAKLEKVTKALRLDERLKAIEDASGAGNKVESLERRASWQGDHLTRPEDRVAALERQR